MGAGLAGMAAALHLKRAGMRVICIDGEAADADPVGESLDWSAPELLKGLGLPMELLLARGIATSKRHVILKLLDGSERHYMPGDWLARAPFHVELATMHVDRGELGKALREIVQQHGIEVLADRVTDIERNGGRILSVTTQSGRRIVAPWFIDASGNSARLFARMFNVPAREYGPAKVAMWDYFSTHKIVEGTTLYGSVSNHGKGSRYMDWIWQIPIHAETVSVGCVSTGDTVKEQRQRGLSVQEIYDTRLEEFRSLVEPLKKMDDSTPRVTSFRCRVHQKVAGPNWLMVGEAASMVDPMTSNGVTAALRHASEAAALIIRSRRHTRLPRLASLAYTLRVRALARFFNSGIEKVMYEWPVRTRIGALAAGDVYTIPAWLMNLIYARIQPRGLVLSAAFSVMLASLGIAASLLSWICRWTAPVDSIAKGAAA